MRKTFYTLVILMILAVSSYKVAFALFSDSATSQNNTFTAAAVFPTATPSATPTPTPITSSLFMSDTYTCPNGASVTEVSEGTVSITKTTDLSVSVTLSGALPNTSYDLWVNQDPGACPLSFPTVPSFIATDGSGNGSNTLNDHTLVGGATKFWVSMVGGTDVLRSVAVAF